MSMEKNMVDRRAESSKTEREHDTPELLAKYLSHIGQGNLLTHREEIDLSNAAKSGDVEARRRRTSGSWSAWRRNTGATDCRSRI